MNFDPKHNYAESRWKAGYIARKEATQEDYRPHRFYVGPGSTSAIADQGKIILSLPCRDL